MTEQQLAKLYKLDLDDDRVMSLAMQLWNLGNYDQYLELNDPEEIEAKKQEVDQIAAELTPCYDDGLIKLTQRAISTSTEMLRFAMRLDQFCSQQVENNLRIEYDMPTSDADLLLDRILQGEVGVPELITELLKYQYEKVNTERPVFRTIPQFSEIEHYAIPLFIRHLREWFMRTQSEATDIGFEAALIQQFPKLTTLREQRSQLAMTDDELAALISQREQKALENDLDWYY